MLFSSSIFWLLVAGAFTLTLGNQRFLKSANAQNGLFLVTSALFYAGWDWRFLGLIGYSIVLDYSLGRAIDATRIHSRRKLFLGLSIAGNLGMLFYFKYLGFFVEETSRALAALGFQINSFSLEIILPVGISFYTFQTLSYTIDVYRGTQRAERNMLTYAAYVAFFPQLLAGPIERAHKMLPQFSRLQLVTWAGIYQGLCLIIVGLFLKVVVADSLAPIVDQIFAIPTTYNGGVLLLGGLYFSVQIYADFCGYSTIALGLGYLFGIHLSVNFKTPLLATSITDFWRRWHITLTQFLRDYMYFPLGGNRHKHIRNVLCVFLISGLWHGANWTFVLWGGLNGAGIAFAIWMRRFWPAMPMPPIIGWLITLLFVVLCFIVFRSSDVGHAYTYLFIIFTDFDLPNKFRSAFKFVIIAGLLDLLWRKDPRLSRGFIPQLTGRALHAPLEALVFCLLLGAILIANISHVDQNAFIYFAF